MFYWNQRELLSAVSHRCREMAARCWAVTTVKRWNEGSGSMAAWAVESGRKCTFFFPLRFQVKDVQERSALVMATGAAPSQPHISSQSHLVDRGSLTQSLRVPEEPVDSSSTRPCCYGASATGATAFLWACLLCITLGTSAWCVSLSSWRNINVLKELERGDAKWLLTRNYVPDKVVFGSLRCHRAHYVSHDDLRQQIHVHIRTQIFL